MRKKIEVCLADRLFRVVKPQQSGLRSTVSDKPALRIFEINVIGDIVHQCLEQGICLRERRSTFLHFLLQLLMGVAILVAPVSFDPEYEAVLVAVTLEPVFTAENLAKVAALSDRFRELPGVDRVFSLATAPNLLATGGDVDVRTFTQQAADDPSRIPEFKKQLDANPVYRGALVSRDGRSTAFAISLSGADEGLLLSGEYPTHIREIVHQGRVLFAREKPGPLARQLGERLERIKFGLEPDPHEWVLPVR